MSDDVEDVPCRAEVKRRKIANHKRTGRRPIRSVGCSGLLRKATRIEPSIKGIKDSDGEYVMRGRQDFSVGKERRDASVGRRKTSEPYAISEDVILKNAIN